LQLDERIPLSKFSWEINQATSEEDKATPKLRQQVAMVHATILSMGGN